ncbi:hypothetical protein AMJ57_00020 [Parcubacteria bacterium SG8_24]|nr:MAG: hypothetical protein AMJ57_00020 [Parcubacteria bacterium SG8_24]
MPNLIERIDEWLLYHSPVKLTDKVFFTENLRVMIHAGLSISEALNTLALQSESKTFRKVIMCIKEDVEGGKLLSSGLAKFPAIFPNIFVSMVQIGEMSGTMETSLDELTQQMKKDYKLRSKVKGAMTYPIVILLAMLGITTGMIVFVLPRLLGIFKEFGEDIQLPLATRLLIVVSDFVQNNGLLVAVMFGVLVAGIVSFSRTDVGRRVFHLGIIRSPIIGPIARKVNLARFSRTLAGLLKTDIPIVQSLQVTAEVVGNVHYKTALIDAGEKIKKGGTIADSLGAHGKLFQPLVVQMTLVGERSGTVDEMLGDIADFFEAQVDNTLNSMSSIIEPILILLLGGMVGGVALAVIQPMYTLTQALAES